MSGSFDEIVAVLADDHRLTKKTTREVLTGFVTLVSELTWELGRLNVPGLAMFIVRQHRSRNVINIDTSLPMTLPAHHAVTARVAKSWRLTDPRTPAAKLRAQRSDAPLPNIIPLQTGDGCVSFSKETPGEELELARVAAPNPVAPTE